MQNINSNNDISYFSTGSELFTRLNSILFIPFGNKNDHISSGEPPITFEQTATFGTYFKLNYPCAVVDLNNKEALRIKHIPQIIPEKIKPITEFTGHSRNWDYFIYLRDVYKDHSGEYKTKGEEKFIDLYFDLCWKQLSDRLDEWNKSEYENEFARKNNYLDYSQSDWEFLKFNDYYVKPPMNDGRWVYEALLPIHEPHLFFQSTGVMNKMNQQLNQQRDLIVEIDEGYCTNKEYFVPCFQKGQTNKNFVTHTRIDFVFWTGQKFLFYEVDGDKKKFAEHIERHEDISGSGNFLKRLTNSDVNKLEYTISELSSDYKTREKVLGEVFPEEILKYWESTPSDSPLHELCDTSRSFHEQIKDPSSSTVAEAASRPYMSLPYHLREVSLISFDKSHKENKQPESNWY